MWKQKLAYQNEIYTGFGTIFAVSWYDMLNIKEVGSCTISNIKICICLLEILLQLREGGWRQCHVYTLRRMCMHTGLLCAASRKVISCWHVEKTSRHYRLYIFCLHSDKITFRHNTLFMIYFHHLHSLSRMVIFVKKFLKEYSRMT